MAPCTCRLYYRHCWKKILTASIFSAKWQSNAPCRYLYYRPQVKVTCLCVEVSRHVDIRVSGGIAPRILTSTQDGGDWSASRFAAVSQYPLKRRLGRPHGRSGRGGEEKNSLHCHSRELNPGRSSRRSVVMLRVAVTSRCHIALNVPKWFKIRRFQEDFSSGNVKVTRKEIMLVWWVFQDCFFWDDRKEAKNRFTEIVVWEGALSWCKIHLSGQWFGLFRRMVSANDQVLESRLLVLVE